RTGEAISFITPRETAHLKLIEQLTKSKMKRMAPPTQQEAVRGKQQATAEKIVQHIQKDDLTSYRETAVELLEEHDSVTVIAAALKTLRQDRNSVAVRNSAIAIVSVKKAENMHDKKGRNNKRFYGKGKGKGKGRYKGTRNRKDNFKKRRNRGK